jgi:hypothetical protein
MQNIFQKCMGKMHFLQPGPFVPFWHHILADVVNVADFAILHYDDVNKEYKNQDKTGMDFVITGATSNKWRI